MQLKNCALGIAGAAVIVLSNNAANAQPAQSEAEPAAAPHERVIVYAPYVVVRKVVNPMMSKTSAAGVEVVTETRSVSYAGLNLSQPPDETILENRVREAAEQACREIDKRYPKSVYTPIPQNQDCVGNAVNQAMIVVKDLEDAASVYGPIPR